MRMPLLFTLTTAFCSLFFANFALSEEGFSSTWKLLSPDAKEQFLAGYVKGWNDAAGVTDVVAEFVKDNPQKAVDGLKKIRTLYDLSAFKASALAKEIDGFFKDPQNASASLSKAVTYAKIQLSQ